MPQRLLRGEEEGREEERGRERKEWGGEEREGVQVERKNSWEGATGKVRGSKGGMVTTTALEAPASENSLWTKS